ncbi:uncharacterized protein BP5553_04845 [Venustampulla echinocandica]|uniref:DUF6590 domain-containing protein n=1 Tax=Venustampulla echinocandica TaxID=2656787 RepID=A0A370TPG5_9HELO|nr:uncharacterized protein BP5553_04845 [Venustampulla echinocandica]RDL37412.1 hypothetical protein BP5553_04845 [Venustampulla echinocandica]
METPWIREPETGRYYMNARDSLGNPVRRYSEELYPTEPYQSQQPAVSQYAQRTPRSELGQNSYLPTSPGPSGAGNQRHESESWYRPSGTAGAFQSPGAYQASPTYSPTASDWSRSSNITSMTSQMNNLAMGDLDRDHQYTATAPSGPSWTAKPTSSYHFNTNQGQAASASGFGKGPAAISAQQDHPSSQNRTRRHLTRTDGDTERLDSRYRIRNNDYKKFFREGRVFSTLWTDQASKQTNRNQTFISIVTYNEQVHTKIRRFVVVRQNNQNCICLPVTSYEGRGHRKSGIELDKHGQIYSNTPPKETSSISKKPLKIVLSREADPLKDQSLINYGTPYTVECNVKVMNIGELDSGSLKLLLRYYSKVHFRPEDCYDDMAMDSKPREKDEDLAGVGTAFASNFSGTSGSSTYSTSPGYSTLAQGQIEYKTQPSYTTSYPADPGYSSRPAPISAPSSSSTTQSQSSRRDADYQIEEEDEDIKLPTREDAQASRSSRSRRDSESKPSRSSGKEKERNNRDRHRHRDRDRDRDRDRKK